METRPEPRWMVASDLDHTWVGTDRAALAALQEAVGARRRDLVLVYATGRDLVLYQELAREAGLLAPDFLVASVGTEIHPGASADPDPEWADRLRPGWDPVLVDRAAGAFPALGPQPRQFRFKRSFYVAPDEAAAVLPALQARLAGEGLSVRLVYSSGRDLDVLPAGAGKGEAVDWLRRRLGLPVSRVVACGDSANDRDLLDRPWGSVLVATAHPDLLEGGLLPPTFHARGAASAGVLEGLRHFGVLG